MTTINTFIISDKLKKLLSERRIIKKEKSSAVKEQKYEKAAIARDKEKKSIDDIFKLLQKEFKYDFSKSRQVQFDILMILDLIEEDEQDFTNAIQRLGVMDLERLKLMKDIERYNLKEIDLDDLHVRIKDSFASIKEYYNETITKNKRI